MLQPPRVEEDTWHRGTQKRGAIKKPVVLIPPHIRAADVQCAIKYLEEHNRRATDRPPEKLCHRGNVL